MAANDDRDDAGGARTATLEEFLIACQKSLARSSASAKEAGKADSEFAEGERPVYTVDGLDIELNAGVQLAPTAEGAPGDRVLLDFDAAAERRSRLRFRVDSRPVEILAGAKLELANLDPAGEELPLVRLRVWLVDPKGAPVPGHPVVVHFARAGDKRRREKEDVEVRTDVVGRVDLHLETDKAERNLKIVGTRRRSTVHVRGSGRGRAGDEFYVWVTCAREPDWERVVVPAAPRPPVAAPREGEPQPEMSSELLRLKLG